MKLIISRTFGSSRGSMALGFVAALLGAAVLASALPARAITRRDVLIKGTETPAVYYLSSNGKRYVFPTFGAYRSWYGDFDDVITVPPTELRAYTLGGNVTYRPGIRLVKIRTDAKVYAVEKGGKLRWITSETVARRLYGSDWNKKIDDIPDSMFVNYEIGEPITTETEFDPVGEASLAKTPGEDKALTVSATALKSDTVPAIGDAATQRGVTAGTGGCLADLYACNDWLACSASSQQTRTCTKKFECIGIDTPSPLLTRACVAPGICSEGVWTCGAWGACSNSGTRTRTCTKTKTDCAVASPATVEDCQPPVATADNCTADTWSCGDWGACSANGKQGRTCGLMVDCATATTPPPSNLRDCTPEYPMLRVTKSATVSTTSHEPGDTNVSIIAVNIKAEEVRALLTSLSFTALVDVNDDGTYHVGTEGGAYASAMLQSCDLLVGEAPISTGVDLEPEGLLVFDLSDTPVEIAVDQTLTFTVRCDIPQQVAEGFVGLSLTEGTLGTPGVTAESGDLAGLDVPDENIQGLPINGDGETVASTIINIINGRAYPIVTLAAMNSDLQPGEATYARFTVGAANAPIAFKQLTFMIEHDLAGTATIATTSGSSLRPISGGPKLAGMSAFVRSLPASTMPSCQMSGDWYCVLVVTLADEIVVTPGEAQTFDLRLTVADDFGSDDNIRTSLMSDYEGEDGQLTEPTPGYGYGIGDVVDSFLWSDLSAGSHNDGLAPAGSNDWFNGYDVYGLPTDSQTLIAL